MPWAAMPGGGGPPWALGGGWAGPLGGRGGIDEFVVAAGLLAAAADAPTVGDMDRADDVDPVGEGVGLLGGGAADGGAPDEGGARLSGGAGAGPSNGLCR